MGQTVTRHHIPQEVRDTISARYRSITKAVNSEIWGISSETSHSLYVGSYGRGTAVDSSDVDILIEVPRSFHVSSGYSSYNPQSRLLQVVREAVLTRYPRTEVRADGQVVVVEFSDGMRFEVLPAFRGTDACGSTRFEYPDTHMGGRWLSTNPKAEQNEMSKLDAASNGLLKATCRHMRIIRDKDYRSYHLSGIVIDSFVCKAIGNWHFTLADEQSNCEPGEYERSLLSWYNQLTESGSHDILRLTAPGSGMEVSTQQSYECLGKVLRAMV